MFDFFELRFIAINNFFISEERSSRATTSPSPPFGTRIIFFVDDGSKSTAAQLARSTGYLLQIIRCGTTRLHFRSPRTDRADVTSALAFLASSSLHRARRRFRSPPIEPTPHLRPRSIAASSLHLARPLFKLPKLPTTEEFAMEFQ